MKNEVLRIFLAVMALVLTALLTQPMINSTEIQTNDVIQSKIETHPEQKNKKITKKSKSTRQFAFFWRR